MINFSDLIELNEQNELYLKEWPDELESTEELLSFLKTNHGDIQLWSDTYYSFMLKMWKGKLNRYPLGSKVKGQLLSFVGIPHDIPLSFLNELSPLFDKIYHTYTHRIIEEETPFIASFIEKGYTILEIKGESQGRVRCAGKIKS